MNKFSDFMSHMKHIEESNKKLSSKKSKSKGKKRYATVQGNAQGQ